MIQIKVLYLYKIIPSLKYEIRNLSFPHWPIDFYRLNYSFIKIKYKETPKFAIEPRDSEQNPKFYISNNISEEKFNSFPEKLYNIKFSPLKNLTLIKPNNVEYAILLINFAPVADTTYINFIDKVDRFYIDLDEIYEIFDEYTTYYFDFYSNYQYDIFMLTYNFTKEYTGEIIIKCEIENKTEKIINKTTDKIYLELYGSTNKMTHYINFKNLDNNIFNGKFNLARITGQNYFEDINKNIIEFAQMETSKETGPIFLAFSIFPSNHLKKIDIGSGNISQIISIRKYNYNYYGDFEAINSNYYCFEKNYNYFVQIKLMKTENNNYMLYPFKLIEIPQKNIEQIKESKTITYNENDIDKFILLDLIQHSKFNITLMNNISKLNMAKISYNQYQNFPKDIQNIVFEKIENNTIQFQKVNNDCYFAFLINLKENSTRLEILLEADNNQETDGTDNANKEKKGLSTLSIVLISISCVIFVVIIVVIFIIIKKKREKNNIKIESLNSELMDMNKNDLE